MATFHNKLVLNKYLLSQFGVLGFEALAHDLKGSHLEGYNEEGNTKYLNSLINRLFDSEKLTKEMLQEYDENIVRFTHEISKERLEIVKWKYFQYLSLLFVEIYLDKYFSNRVKLLGELNQFVEKYNDPFYHNYDILNPTKIVVSPFTDKELNKIAFWNATGSGKTLLMHINIKQYLHYAKKYHYTSNNKVLLITPNEGLSNQHLEEFELSNIAAEIFSRNGQLFSGQKVEIIEIHKLKDTSGDKTVAVESFETSNLVLIDEGHAGMSGNDWKRYRDYLSETGFAFEYSATFGQAINAASGKNKKDLEQEYVKSIIFDYSYKYFYNDGYGKDYKILNLNDDNNESIVRKYLTANLLSFYQQIVTFQNKEKLVQTFLLEKPLWIFVGGKVNAVRKENGVDTSDVLEIIYFLTKFIREVDTSIRDIDQILNDNAGLIDEKGNSIFYNTFTYLVELNLTAEEVYLDIIKRVFNSKVIGANLYLDNLKGANGELGLRIGEADYFGVVNVGDEAKLHSLAMENKVLGSDKEFSKSLFLDINDKDSKINLLIGSKKFSEGWSSWRVSSMGLMNIGKSEGSQIIQLFGRGVRLKGYNFSLKRSSGLDEHQKPSNLKDLKKYLLPLETLNIFGVKADYMEKFKEFLEQEGLPANDSKWHTIKIPTIIKSELLENNLKIVQVKEKEDFKKKVNVDLQLDNNLFAFNKVELDWYPKIQVLSNKNTSVVVVAKNQGYLVEHNLAFINWKNAFIEIEKYKFDKGWNNLSISLEDLKNIINAKSWYTLFIPKQELEMVSFSQVATWESLVISLLKKYTEKYYNYHKNKFNSEHIETRILDANDDNFVYEYEVKLNVEGQLQTIEERIKQLIDEIKNKSFSGNKQLGSNFIAFDNAKHLYTPLLYLDNQAYKDNMQVIPVPLDLSEKEFMDDLIVHYEANTNFYTDKKVFLLRNQSKKGIGFFVDANNFYPDFILWILKEDKQYITFIDPKGIRNSKGLSDPKIQFHKVVKEKIQPQVSKDDVVLNSFIISNTSFWELPWKEDKTIEDFHSNNVVFQNDKNSYMSLLMSKVLG
jgi:hypothetical protein